MGATGGQAASRSPSTHSGHPLAPSFAWLGGQCESGLFLPGDTPHDGHGPSCGHTATEPLRGHTGIQSSSEMSPLRAARPDDLPNSHHFMFQDQRCIMQIPRKQRPFLRRAGDFIMHSRLRDASGSLSSVWPGTRAGRAARSARSRPWPRSGGRIRWERASGLSTALIAALVTSSLGRAQKRPLCADELGQGLLSFRSSPDRRLRQKTGH